MKPFHNKAERQAIYDKAKECEAELNRQKDQFHPMIVGSSIQMTNRSVFGEYFENDFKFNKKHTVVLVIAVFIFAYGCLSILEGL